MDKRVYTMYANIENAEIRAVNLVQNEFNSNGKKVSYEYIDLKVDDENGERIYLKDKCVDNMENYHRGDIGTFVIRIECEEDFKKKCDITVSKFKKNN